MRIASLISAGTEMLFALGLGEQVVAVSHECDWPPRCNRLPRVTRSNIDAGAASGAIDGQVRQLLIDGKPLHEVHAAQLAELQPDLIVTQAQCDVCAVRYADVLNVVQNEPRLNQTKVFSLNPQSLVEVFDDMLRLGTLAGIADHANQVVDGLRSRVEQIHRRTVNIPMTEQPRVAMIEWTDPLMLAGNWVPELVELAGGRCDLTPPGQHSRTFSWDELFQFNPELIVVCPCGFDRTRAASEVKVLSRRSRWNELAAVKARRVYPIDGNAYFNRPGPRLVDSLELLAQLVATKSEPTDTVGLC